MTLTKKLTFGLFLIISFCFLGLAKLGLRAGPPFDELDNRKLTIYGGVVTIVNELDDNAYALEIGQAFNDGLGLASTGKIHFLGQDGNRTLTINPANNRVGINNSWPGHTLSIVSVDNDIRPLGLTARGNDQIDFRKEGGNTIAHTFLDRSNVGFRFWDINAGQSIFNINPASKNASIGISQEGPASSPFGARLMVNNPWASGKHGSSGDAIYTFSNSTNHAAISAEQAGTGWAGYFSGKVGVFDGNLYIGTAGSPQQICWNGEDNCKTGWEDIGGGGGTIGGGGTANYLSKWTNANTLGNSVVYERDEKISIGMDELDNPGAKFVVNNPAASGKVGFVKNAIYAYANSIGAAISGDHLRSQIGEAHYYAGYFSGRVAMRPNSNSNDYATLYVENRSGRAAFFDGRVTIGLGSFFDNESEYENSIMVPSSRRGALEVYADSPDRAAVYTEIGYEDNEGPDYAAHFVGPVIIEEGTLNIRSYYEKTYPGSGTAEINAHAVQFIPFDKEDEWINCEQTCRGRLNSSCIMSTYIDGYYTIPYPSHFDCQVEEQEADPDNYLFGIIIGNCLCFKDSQED